MDQKPTAAEQRIRFAVVCAKKVCAEPTFGAWAEAWLSGADRSYASAAQAAAAAAWAAAAEAAAEAAEAWAAEAAAAEAAKAAEAAARARKPLDLVEIARRALQ